MRRKEAKIEGRLSERSNTHIPTGAESLAINQGYQALAAQEKTESLLHRAL